MVPLQPCGAPDESSCSGPSQPLQVGQRAGIGIEKNAPQTWPGLIGRRQPMLPGHFLETRYLKPLGINQQALAVALNISRRRVNELIRGRRGISADTALRLSIYFNSDARFWMQLQADWDLHEAARRLRV